MKHTIGTLFTCFCGCCWELAEDEEALVSDVAAEEVCLVTPHPLPVDVDTTFLGTDIEAGAAFGKLVTEYCGCCLELDDDVQELMWDSPAEVCLVTTFAWLEDVEQVFLGTDIEVGAAFGALITVYCSCCLELTDDVQLLKSDSPATFAWLEEVEPTFLGIDIEVGATFTTLVAGFCGFC